MRKVSLAVILVILSATLASARVVTRRFDWAPRNGVQVLNWSEDGVTVKQVSFDLGSVVKPLRISTAHAQVMLDNDSDISVVPGIAVAIFDANNNLVAAGEGGVKIGTLGKWQRDTFDIDFKHVFRHLNDAKYFYVTVEMPN